MTAVLPARPPGVAGPHDLRLVPAAVTLWLAALAGQLLAWWVAVVIGSFAGAAAVIAGSWGSGRVRAAAGATGVAAVLVLWPLSAVVREAEQDPLAEHAARGGYAQLRMTVTDRARPLRGSAGEGGRSGGARAVVIRGEAEAIRVSGTPVGSSGRLVLIARQPQWHRVLPGQRLTVEGTLTPARSGDLTVAVVQVRGPPARITEAPWWQRAAQVVRADLRTVSGVLGEDEAGLLPGLVVGDTSTMPVRVEREFIDAGMSHLVAVSGSNVAIICGAVLLLLRACRVGPRTSAACAALVLAGFVVLVGYEPSVLRAGVMGGVGLLALLLGRKGSAMPALAFAVGVLVAADPAMAVSFGFALSVVATAALVLVAPVWAAAMRRRGVPPGIAEALAIPLAAFVATAPIIAGMAGEVSLVTVAANVLATPVVAFATVFGVLAASTAPMVPWLAEILVRIAGPAVSWLVLVARKAAAVPGAVIGWPAGWWGGILAAAVCLALVGTLSLRSMRVAIAGGLTGVLVVGVPATVIVSGWPPPGWAMVACDVGQGDGLVVATGEPGRAVVVDAGTDAGQIDRCLDRLGVERVPLVVLSHLHADHFGGLGDVIDGRSVGAIAVGPGRTPGWALLRIEEVAAAHGVPVVSLRVGQRLRWPELDLKVIGPRYVAPGSTEEGDGTEVNDASLVLAAETAAGRVLLTGDVELAAQADLLASGEDLRADVLKVPHHGSRYTSPEFLAAVSPRIAVVSVGKDNRHGHPNHTVLDQLRGLGTVTARTDTGGDTAVIAADDGPAVVARGVSGRRPGRGRLPVSSRGHCGPRRRSERRSPSARSCPGPRRASSGRRR